MINELKSHRPGGYVRHYNTHVRRGSLEASIEEARQRPSLGRAKAEIWVCSDQTEAHELVGELAKVNAFSHAFVFTDLQDEMRLGTGRHRIDQ